ncbi:MAG: PTS sugar transporter subunit IIA [Candidatus Omnitrophica bacterium]|nr:PTS sugar transporter subunit IIA [Candidatus Omnitrophota bacterium]
MNINLSGKKYIETPEAAQLLGVSEHALERWIRQGAIPYSRSKGLIVFDEQRLKEWAESHNMTWMKPLPSEERSKPPVIRLSNAIRNGGVYNGVSGNDVESVLKSAVAAIHFPHDVDREELLEKLLERESMASTGIGHGAAVPHPRTSLKMHSSAPSISVCFLESPVPYNAVDGEPVFVLFLMLSPSTKVHLKMLARLGFCLRDESFLAFLRNTPDLDSLCQRVETMEKKMETTHII